jgi:hypothetical protein
VGLFFIYIFLLACEMIFLQDSCTQIRFHVCTVILLTVRLVSRITRSHISGTCCVHVHCDQKTKLTYYSIRGKKAEAYPHAYIYRYIYIERERFQIENGVLNENLTRPLGTRRLLIYLIKQLCNISINRGSNVE